MRNVKLKFALTFLWIISIILMLGSCSFSSNACKKLLHASSAKSYDLIIVPGVPLENGKWSNIMKARIYWSKYLFDKGIAKNIMYSGSAVYSPYIEAEIMAMYAEALGIPRQNIYTETQAEHSTENIYYSYLLSKKLNFNHIAIASDPFQTKMLQKFTRKKVNPGIILIPIVFDTLRVMVLNGTDPVIDIRKAFVKDFVALPQREGFFKRLKGSSGAFIQR